MSKNISSLSGREGKELDDPLWERPNGAVVLDPRSDSRLISSLVRVGFLAAGRL